MAANAITSLRIEHITKRFPGIVACSEGGWLHFDYTPGEPEVRMGAADYTGRLCVIGAELKEHELDELFHLS